MKNIRRPALPAEASNRQRRSVSFVVLLFSVALVGCENNVYEIDLSPQGESIERKLTVWRQTVTDDGPELRRLNPEELENIARIYGSTVKQIESKKYKFAKGFGGRMPEDVGGAGWYQRLDSPMGSAAGYVEQFRGNDNLYAGLNQRFQAVDRLTELVAGWTEAEFASHPQYAQIHGFVKGPLSRDLRDLCLYTWSYGISGRTVAANCGGGATSVTPTPLN